MVRQTLKKTPVIRVYQSNPCHPRAISKAEVLRDIRFNTDRGEALVNSGWVMATDLAESLVLECGLDFRSAHHLVAFLASEYRGKSIQELDHETLMQAAVKVPGRSMALIEQQLKAALLALQARTQPAARRRPA
jgi:argininosuccinate lyase